MSVSVSGRRSGSTPRLRKQFLVRATLVASGYAAALSVLISGCGIVGYTLGWRYLWRPISDSGAIHPISALCLIAIASAAWLLRPGHQGRASLSIALVTVLISALLIGLAVTGHARDLNTVSPFHDALAAEASTGRPVLIGPFAGVMLFLLSLAIILRHLGHSSAAQLVVGSASIAPMGTLLGFAYGMSGTNTLMAPVTAASSLLAAMAIAGRTAHKVPLRSVLTINLPGHLIRVQILILVGVSLILSMIAARSRWEDDARTFGIEVAVLMTIILLTLANAAYRWQQEQQRQTAERARVANPLASALDGAWDRGELFLVYQPQVRLADEALAGVEALARWQHPTLGLVSPADFIPLAEKAGLINPLGAWVFKTACQQAAQWHDGVLSNVVISVNVSAIQLEQEGCAARMIAMLHEAGVSPDRMVVEVTESTLIERGGRALAALKQLKAAGLVIAIDDFGTGFSSLSSLQTLPSRYLKIDRSFVLELPDNHAAAMIVRAVVGMGRALDMKVIAEGVETIPQATFLKEIGCEKAQGYLYGRPQPAAHIEAYVALSLIEASSRRRIFPGLGRP